MTGPAARKIAGMELRAGTSGFSYKEWKGPFYPEDLANDRMLEYYGERLPAVEINNTFYRLPKAAVLAGWAEKVPVGFRFSIKASRRITHFKRLKEPGDETAYLVETVGALGRRLGALLFQLPPNFAQDVPRLRAFLAALPEGTPAAFEFRHDSWFDDETYDALRARDIALCVTEQPEFASPVVATASWGYARLHRLDYDEAALGEWAKRIAGQPWSEAYVFFKHDEGIGSGPPAVDAFRRALEA
jgi:uncharacterized protein YecE (DUF72 family)